MPEPLGLSDLIIADRVSDANQRRIRGVSGLQVSWELSYAGELSCQLPLRDLQQAGFQPLDLTAKWLHYEHPTAGPWGGVITDVSGSDGIVAINAQTWAAELQGVSAARSGVTYGLMAELERQIDLASAMTGIRPGRFDYGGTDVQVTDSPINDSEDLYESFLPMVLERWEDANGWRGDGMQAFGWNIDPVTRVFRFDASYGTDLSWRVGLLDGRHNTHSEFSDSLMDVVNRVHLVGSVNGQYTETVSYRNNRGQLRYRTITHTGVQTHHAIATNDLSIARYGSRELPVRRDYPTAAAMDAAALDRVTYLAVPLRPVTIETADVDGSWAKFREGDLISLGIENSGVRGRMVVRHRALDVARGTMRVSGEAQLYGAE